MDGRGIINYATGEVTFVPEGSRIEIVTPNTMEYLKTLSDYQKSGEQKLIEKGYVPFRPDKNHVKVFTREFNAINDELSSGAVALLMLLMPYARMGSNVLFSLNNKIKLNQEYIIDNISPFSRQKTIEVMQEMKRLVVVVEASDMGRSKQYVMNPYIYFKGKYINKTILDLFSRYKKRS